MSNRVLRTQFPAADANLEEEESLAREAIDLGAAWHTSNVEEVENGNAVQRDLHPSHSSLKILGEDEIFTKNDEDDADDSETDKS
jgi:hypothetical protein